MHYAPHQPSAPVSRTAAVRREDRWKVAVLLALIVAVLAFGGFYTLPGLLGPRSTADAPTQVRSRTGTDSVSGAAQITPRRMATAADSDEDTTPLLDARDPFRPPRGTPVPVATVKPVPPQAASRPLPPPPVVNQARVPAFWNPAPLAPVRPAPVAAPPLPSVQLKGVIEGDPPIAVMDIGGETFYKQEGDRIADGVGLVKITSAGVVLRAGGRNTLLTVGHSTQPERTSTATPPSAPPSISMMTAAASVRPQMPKRLAVAASPKPIPSPGLRTATPEAGTADAAVTRRSSHAGVRTHVRRHHSVRRGSRRRWTYRHHRRGRRRWHLSRRHRRASSVQRAASIP